ncbi:hypothetical protein V6N11_060551 [Hibiscus sabdariffa]|uniref:Endonuclease/exonuclease/phosphatase domain-containing protein n=1 Tax=Hibiscus sabdariffa TaxID=183260 RepID=A0ABR2QR23_9ROSI
MRVLSWNVRGLGAAPKQKVVREIFRKHKCTFLLLQETKLESISDTFMSKLWFDDQFRFAFAPAVGKSGGIMVIWNSVRFAMEEVHVASRFISVVGSWVMEQWRGGVVGVYSPCVVSEQKDGGVTRHCEVIVVVGWTRYLVSDAWLLHFLDLRTISLPRGLLDHTPILLCNAYTESGPKPFHFLNAWIQHHDYSRDISQEWYALIANSSRDLVNKLRGLRVFLKHWNKKSFGDIDRKYATTVRELDLLDHQAEGMSIEEELVEKQSKLRS